MPLAIVLDVDSPIGLTIMRELGRNGVPVHGIGAHPASFGKASRYCTQFSVRQRHDLAKWLPDVIEQTGAKALFAIGEADLLQLAQMPVMVNGCQIMTPRSPQLDAALDKRLTLEIAQTVGIETPRDFIGTPTSWPVVLKWADPNQVLGLLDDAGLEFLKTEYCTDMDALVHALARYQPITGQPLVQEFAKGVGLGQMFHFENGRATLFFQHERLHEWPPEGGVSTLCCALPDTLHQPQRLLSERLLTEMGWDGPAMVEYRYDAANARYVLMEVNARFWGSQSLANHCGATFAWEIYRRRILEQTAPAAAYRGDLKARYMVPETKRLLRLFLQNSQIEKTVYQPHKYRDLLGYVRDFFDRRSRYYVACWDDPKPLFADILAIIGKILRPNEATPDGQSHALSAQNIGDNRPLIK